MPGTAASELRQNKATREWVIYAPARRKRKRDFAEGGERGEAPEHDADCPFCPGNEEMLPSIIEASGGDGQGWQIRVVPNKYPALTPTGALERSRSGIYLTMQGHGSHEVVIESPHHNRQPAMMSLPELERIIESYHRRYSALMKDEKHMLVTIFRNHGARAGTSLKHPHSQIIAIGVVPHYVRWREEEAQHYYDEWGRCVHCDILAQEQRDGRRIVYGNETYTAFVPFAAGVPYETWIMPNAHQADFGELTDRGKGDLAAALKHILGRLREKLNDPDYNYIFNTSVRYRTGEPHAHWYLQIRPRLMTRAGFEIGSGISINPSLPEEDAAFLKAG
jgi:UDPglucose--hexose-1-phosphate uridylyltransferase